MDFDSLLQGVNPATVAALDQQRVRKRLEPGENLLRVGEPTHWIAHVRAGRVKVWRPFSNGQALTLAYLTNGMMAGLLACCNERDSPSTATAVIKTEIDRWPQSLIRQLLASDAMFARNALDIAGRYAAKLIDKLEDTVGSAERRIGRALLRLAGEDGDWRREDRTTLQVSRQDLADMTGATLFTASRTLSDWERRGLVESSRGRVVLTDLPAIAQIADLVA